MLKHKTFLIILALLTVSVAVYSPAIRGEFQFDDDTFIAENPSIVNPLLLFDYPFGAWFFSGNRLLTNSTFAATYALGGFSVEGYHLFNILVHLLTTVAVYFIVRKMIVASSGGRGEENSQAAAIFVAAIFALHPLQTEAVSYVVQRAEVLASLFYLVSLLCFMRYNETSGRNSAVFWVLAMFFFLVGFGFKEIVVTVPVMFLLYSVFFDDRAKIRKAALGIAPAALAGAVVSLKLIIGLQGSSVAGFGIEGVGQPEYFYTQLRVLVTYLRLIFFPMNQNLDYDYPLYGSFWDAPVISSMFLWVVVVLISLSSLRAAGAWKWHLRRAGFGMIWFLVVLFPTSSLLPLKDLIFEHRLYLAITGVALTIVSLAGIIAASLPMNISAAQRWLPAASVILLLLLAVLTVGRNRVWETKLSLWQDAVAKSPLKSRSQNNLGNCYYLLGEDGAALERYRLAVKFDPDNIEAYYNLSLVFERLGRRAEAATFFAVFTEKNEELRQRQTRSSGLPH